MDSADRLLSPIRIVLVRPSHPGNIGAAARAMKTMGLSRLYLVNPARFPDPQAEAMASGAADVLAAAQLCGSLAEALTGAVLAFGTSTRKREIVARWLTPEQAAPELLAEAGAGREAALVFGNETYGLSNAELGQCQALVTVPANAAYSSLNLAAAVQVLSYELRRQALGDAVWPEPPLDAADLLDVERFYRDMEATLTALGFLDPASPKRLMPKLRRLFSRTRLAREEINILRGILSSAASRGRWQD